MGDIILVHLAEAAQDVIADDIVVALEKRPIIDIIVIVNG
jgi:hypothetical protein